MISVQEQTTGTSLFELAGGASALRSLVDELFLRIQKDSILRETFVGEEVAGLKRLQVAYFAQVLGGPSASRTPLKNPLSANRKYAARIDGHVGEALRTLNLPDPIRSQIAQAVSGSSETRRSISRQPLLKSTRAGSRIPRERNRATRAKEPTIELAELRACVAALKRVHASFELESNGDIRSADEKFAAALGYASHELEGLSLQSLLETGQRAALDQQQLWSDLRDGRARECDLKLQGKSGQDVWFGASFAPVSAPDGTLLKIVCFARDIGEMRRSAAELTELRVKADLVNLTSIVSESNLKGDIIAINDKFCEVSQYSREELLGKPHNTTRHPDMPKETFRQLWATIGSGKTFRGVIKNRKKDGTPYYVDAVVAPVLGENGKPRKYIGVRYDITEMEIERQKMRGILAAINSAYSYIEFDTKGTVLSANERFLNALGYSQEEVLAKHHRMFVDPSQSSSAEYSRFWADLNSGLSQAGIFKRITKGGREIYIQAVYAPVKDETGRVLKIVKIATDVTAQKVAEINANRQIEELNRSQATIEFDGDGMISNANDNFLKLSGYRLDDLKGRPQGILIDPAQRESAECRQLWRDLKDGKFQTSEFKWAGKGGSEIWVQATYSPYFGVDGRVNKVVTTAMDITARKRAEANLVSTLAAVGQNAQALGSAAEELSANSQQMVGNAEETATQANVVSAAAEQVSKNVQTVATGTEEMSASIKEIAKNAMDAAKVAAVAVKAAETTNSTVSKLGESSAEIGKVIKVITSIAQQTNLLALNATIEAARAGEAGKGFAVVANEVKELAKETAKATEDISQKIEAIQADTKSAVAAISEISGVINKINDYQNTIASAVEEQTATTNEISRNVTEAARGSSEIAENITGVAAAAKNTTSGANDTQKASEELSRMAAELQKIVASSRL